jgi:hypothetical protein
MNFTHIFSSFIHITGKLFHIALSPLIVERISHVASTPFSSHKAEWLCSRCKRQGDSDETGLFSLYFVIFKSWMKIAAVQLNELKPIPIA